MNLTVVDTNNCDREPVHIPGHVQPHGLLIAVHPSRLSIEQVSDNLGAVLDRDVREIQAAPIESVLSNVTAQRLQRSVLEHSLSEQLRHIGRDDLGTGTWFDVLAHVHDDVLIVELEPVESNIVHRFDMSEILTRGIDIFAASDSVQRLTEAVAHEVRRVSGYFRVMVYQFADGSGEVISESVASDDAERYLGLHHPASDIPAQVGALFRRKRLRMLVDNHASPAHLVPEINPRTARALDMSFGAFRGSSVMCTEYLENMGVRASLTMSVLAGGRLWGMIACHHDTPRAIPYDVRLGCEFLARALGRQLELHLDRERAAGANALLRQSNAELDDFTYVASHDLKEPLRSIRNYAEFLLEDFPPGIVMTEEGRGMIARVAALTRRMDDLIGALLHFSRSGWRPLVRRDSSLRHVIDEVVDDLRASLEASGAELTIQPDLPTVDADPIMLREVLINLISNAVKYVDGDTPRIRIELVPPAPDWPAEAGEAAWAIAIHDNGIGIPVEHAEDVFRIFKRLHAREDYGGGTGVGLSIVRQLTERHGGAVWFRSSPGKEGTTFFVTLSGRTRGVAT